MKISKLTYMLLLALALRLGYVLLFPQPELVGDALEYHALASNLASGNGFSVVPGTPTPMRAPLYPYFLGIIYYLTGFSFLAVQLAQVLLDCLTCLITYFTTKAIFDERTAYLSGFIYALYPPGIAYTRFLLSEILFTFLLAVSIYFLVKALSSDKWPHFIFAGVFLGLSALTRPTTIIFPVYIAVIFFVLTPRNALKLAAYVMAAYLAIMPWTARNYRYFKVFLPISVGGASNTWTTGYQVAYNASWEAGAAATQARGKEYLAQPREFSEGQCDPLIELDRQLLAEGKQMIKAHLKEYIALLVERLPVLWVTSHSGAFNVDKPLGEYFSAGKMLPIIFRLSLLGLQVVLLIAAGLGMIYSFKLAGITLVPLLTIAYFTGHILFDPCPRFHVPVLPYVIMFASYYILRMRGQAPA